MKKVLIFVCALIFLFLSGNLLAQVETPDKYRYNIKLSYNGVFDFYEKFVYEPKNYYRVEANYRLLPYLDVGAQGFYAKQDAATSVVENGIPVDVNSYLNRPRIGLGLNSNFYPLPLIFDNAPHWVEPYISAKWAYSQVIYPKLMANESKMKQVNHRYGIYGGLNLYLGEYFGFYVELGRSNIENYENLNTYIGVTVKF